MGNYCLESKDKSILVKSKNTSCLIERKSIAYRATQSTEEDEEARVFSKKQFQSIKYIGILGQGGQSQVKLISIMQINRQFEAQPHFYALKSIDKDQKENLQLNISLNLQSKFLCPLKYKYETEKANYMIMEVAEGGTLSDFMNYHTLKGMEFQKLGQDMFRFLFAGIIIGLECIHKSGYIHRDLKAQNVLLDGKGYPWLTDFGLSQINCCSVAKGKKGTIFYLAPEIVNQKQYDKSADLWALGVLLQSVAFKQYPYSQEEVLSPFFQRICYLNEFKYNNGNFLRSQKLKDLINRLLRVKKQDRLGYRNFNEIKQHEFFQGINWKEIQLQRLKSPLQQLVTKYNILSQYKEVRNH